MKRRIPVQLKAPRSKYGVDHSAEGKAKRTVDGITFDSLKESRRYAELKIMQRIGMIAGLIADKRKLRYDLSINGQKVCYYEADFFYTDQHGEQIIEDCKGCKTPAYRLKKKLMKAIHGLTITEI